jgi:rhamnosyltransferase
MSGCQPPKVVAVVVTYRCDLDRLAQQFERLLPQVSGIVWVDNGSGHPPIDWRQRWPRQKLRTLWLRHNLGLGAAQNRGVALALRWGATHVLFMDQDSVPAGDMVEQLLAALVAHRDAAAVGACYRDTRRRRAASPFHAYRRGRLQPLPCDDRNRVWMVDHVIASGCLIPASVWRVVGPMREDFFIDWSDIEWCWRARDRGYRIYGVCGARLDHAVGDQVVRRWGQEIPLHPPWRHYYQARNWVLMLRTTGTPWAKKLAYSGRQLRRFLVFSLLVPRRWHHFSMWIKGLWHGVCKRSGMLVAPGQE